MLLWALVQKLIFILPDGGHLGFMGQNYVRIGILVDDLPEKVLSYVIFGALIRK